MQPTACLTLVISVVQSSYARWRLSFRSIAANQVTPDPSIHNAMRAMRTRTGVELSRKCTQGYQCSYVFILAPQGTTTEMASERVINKQHSSDRWSSSYLCVSRARESGLGVEMLDHAIRQLSSETKKWQKHRLSGSATDRTFDFFGGSRKTPFFLGYVLFMSIFGEGAPDSSWQL